MIQRIQTIYLLLISILMSFMTVRPYAQLDSENELFSFHTYAIYHNLAGMPAELHRNTFPVISLVLAAGILSFLTILFFHNRVRQMRMCIVNILLLMLLIGFMLYYYRNELHFHPLHHGINFPAIFPIISIVLCLLAYKNIRMDEMLVRTNERIR
jgi:hypothetical protein